MKIIITGLNSFEVIGDDVSIVKMLDVLKTLINGFREVKEGFEKKRGPVIIEVDDKMCNIITSSLTKGETIGALVVVRRHFYTKMATEARNAVGNDAKAQEQYLDLVLKQGRNNSNKLN